MKNILIEVRISNLPEYVAVHRLYIYKDIYSLDEASKQID